VAMNKSENPRVVTIPTALVNSLDDRTLVDAIHPDRSITVSNESFELSLNPWEYAILEPQ